MKSLRATTPIVRVPILPLGMVNAFALIGKSGVVLVDAGLPHSTPQFEAVLARQGRSLRDVRLIVVTHAHCDHAGGAHALRERSGAPILAHRHELPFLRGERPMTFCPTGWFGRWLLRSGAPREPYPTFDADLVLDKAPIDLSPYGIDGHVQASPGHTPGSLSVILSDGRALVGDMLAGGILLGGIVRTGHAKPPPFEEDPHAVAREIRRLAATGVETFYLGHGGPVVATEATRHATCLELR